MFQFKNYCLVKFLNLCKLGMKTLVTRLSVLIGVILFIQFNDRHRIIEEWELSDTINGLMAIPNLIYLLVLSNVIARECFDFQKNFLISEKVACKKAKKKLFFVS